jgi:hypothetical protein
MQAHARNGPITLIGRFNFSDCFAARQIELAVHHYFKDRLHYRHRSREIVDAPLSEILAVVGALAPDNPFVPA